MRAWVFIMLMACGVGGASAATVLINLQGRSGSGMRFDNENPSASGSGTGGEVGAGITFDDVTNVLTLNVGWGTGNGFTNLTGNATAAHIHQAATSAFTDSGGVIVSLDGATPGYNASASAGGWTNTQVTLSAAQETALLNGQLYLNVHTAANGGGEIRGNMVVVPEPSRMMLLLAGCTFLLARRRRR